MISFVDIFHGGVNGVMTNEKSFIEVQFPVSKVSKESYKERKANFMQTLTGLGKWWGRKPLILVRAAILGLLIPASNDAKRDRDIFLKLLTMDESGLLIRKSKPIPLKILFECSSEVERRVYFDLNSEKPKYKKGIKTEEKSELQRLVFNRFSYDEKLEYCMRPEEVEKLPDSEWKDINLHLGTSATNLQELVSELGIRKFGHHPIIGDCFSGGGSIPYESARLGCGVFASDLNPIAMLLTWSSLNIAGATVEEISKLRLFQEKIYNLVEVQIRSWGIESNESGDQANSYLYCLETVCPECGIKVPLSPSWIIGKGTKTVALLNKGNDNQYDIEVISNASEEQQSMAESQSTIIKNNLHCPNCKMSTPISSLRGDRKNEDGKSNYGLRKWGKDDFIPLTDDVYNERLFCIRYEQEYLDEAGNIKNKRYYTSPTKGDMIREDKVKELLREKFQIWRLKGYIPDLEIEEGYNTSQPIRERGWTHWHHLFSPRQLLVHGLFMEFIDKEATEQKEYVVGMLGINKLSDWNSKLCQWINAGVNENLGHTYYNQALNTFYNYGSKGLKNLSSYWFFNINTSTINSASINMKITDARDITEKCDMWITDPPYADAVNYHELSELFLAWNGKFIQKVFGDWYSDSKRILAVKGTGEEFNNSLINIYKNLKNHSADSGMQIVMFTHQDVKVWAELSMILWSAGLQVSAAWNIATETDANGLKEGNYVKGTVLLILRKQENNSTAFLDELYPEIEEEVISQINSMREIDDQDDPNFSDPDYLLAAYAASLKVLTSYKKIEGIDVEYELSKARNSNEESPIVKIINEAVKIAYDYLIPVGFDKYIWKTLTSEERLYIKGLELEKHNIYQLSAYQELARGFGVNDYKEMLASTKANAARLKTPSEYATRNLNDNSKFGTTILRNILYAVHTSIKEEDSLKGRNWLKTELVDYWNVRSTLTEILKFIAPIRYMENMEHWQQDAHMASILKELIENDGV